MGTKNYFKKLSSKQDLCIYQLIETSVKVNSLHMTKHKTSFVTLCINLSTSSNKQPADGDHIPGAHKDIKMSYIMEKTMGFASDTD